LFCTAADDANCCQQKSQKTIHFYIHPFFFGLSKHQSQNHFAPSPEQKTLPSGLLQVNILNVLS
jgi:hypothetical protein